MRNSYLKRHWLMGSMMIVVFLGIPLFAGAASESGFFQYGNKAKFKAKILLPQGEAIVKYKTRKTLSGEVQKKLECKVEVAQGQGAKAGDTFLCQVEAGGTFVTLAEWKVSWDDDGEVKGKAVLRNENIPSDRASSLVDGARIRVVVNSTPPLNFQGILQEVGKKNVELKAKMRPSFMGKAKVKYESRVKSDGTSNRKFTCKVDLESASGVKTENGWSCYTLIDGTRHDLGLLTWKIDDGDDLEGKLVLRTPADSVPELAEGSTVFIGGPEKDQVVFQGVLSRD